MSVKIIKNCRFCGSNKLKKVINLGYQYLQGYFVDDSFNKKKNILSKRFLTELVRCNSSKDKNACGLLQLSITIPPKLLYKKYFYRSGVNFTMKKHLNNMENILNQIGIENYIFLSVLLFCIGIFGVLYRRNAIIVFMSIEIMLNAVNLLFIAFSTYWQDAKGEVFVFFSMTVAAAEVAVGLALLVSVFRNIGSVDISNLKNLKG